MTRHFGIQTVRPALRGQSEQPTARQRETQYSSRNVIQFAARESSPREDWPNSETPSGTPLFIDDDREFASFMFAILFVGLPALFLGAVYLLLVS